MRIGFPEHIPKWRNHFLPSKAGEVSASYADGGVMSAAGGAHDPSAPFDFAQGRRCAGTSPSRNPRRGGGRESMRPGYGPGASKMPGGEAHHG
jgi:hypothetical protein